MENKWLNNLRGKVSERDFGLIERAIGVLEGNTSPAENLPWSPYRCITPGPGGFNGIWNWDSAFHAMAVSRWDAELAKGFILAFMKFQAEDGMLPDVIRADGDKNEASSKPPVMPWAAEIVYKNCGDIDFIRTLYPKFAKNEQWWCENRCDRGLFYYSAEEGRDDYELQCGWETGWDNSVRWDFARVSELWAIDLNCYMVMLYRAMKFFAEELGMTADAEKWIAKESALATLIEEKMWNDELKSYTDVNRTNGAASDVLSPASFMPLYVGIAPKEHAEAMNRLACDPNKFAYGMPTVTYDNPGYSQDYWRGPTWLNVAYFAAKGLKDYGFESGNKIRDKILSLCDEEKNGIFENYDSRTGKGMGCGCFSWSSAFIVEYILNF